MTEPVYRRAMRAAESGEGLLLLANRFAQMEPLLADGWPDDFAYSEIVQELFSIANGDHPRLLKGSGKQGKSIHAHALLEERIDAHVWYKVLRNFGSNAPEVQSIVFQSYGITSEAYNKWRQEASKKLGADYVRRYLVTAVATYSAEASAHSEPLMWIISMIRKAGDSYKTKLKQSAA